jgi:spore maturation protein CgeB
MSRWRGWVTDRLKRQRLDTPHWLRRAHWRLMGRRVGRSLIKTARDYRPDLVLVLKGETLSPETIDKMKQVTGSPVAVWHVDDPFELKRRLGWLDQVECLPHFDQVFIFDHSYFAELKNEKVKRASFLPCAADPALYHPQEMFESERRLYEAAVSLVGVYFDSRGRIVEGLVKEPGLRMWGPGWGSFLVNHLGEEGRARFQGEELAPEQVAKVYAASTINLNSHHVQSKQGGLNTRAFEIPAAGGFQLMDYVPGMEELLEPGREVAVYKTSQELPELVQRYLKDSDGRKRIARAGHERVLAQHTYRHRMATVLNSL